MEALEFRKHLSENIIPFWNQLKDEKHGGFWGYMDYKLQINKESEKGVILNSRILWFYSTAYSLLKEPELLEMAKHAYGFLSDYCYDAKHGGVYWSVTFDGKALDDSKHTYNQAFAIYALSAFYEASGNKEALELAYKLYDVIEGKCRNRDGYLEAFNRDFTPTTNEKLSENGVMAERTMNTLLHVMEAYTELYRVDGCPAVKDNLYEIMKLFKDKIYDTEKKQFQVFFDLDYHSLIDLHSFGHDIEASWLIDRTCDILGDATLTARMHEITDTLAMTVYGEALDETLGALYNEKEEGIIDKQKIWWVQAEAVIGFYNAHQKSHQNEMYCVASERIWQFIQEKMIDTRSGEWFESVKEDGSIDKNQALVQPWKCPYHNGRMCIEMIRRLE